MTTPELLWPVAVGGGKTRSCMISLCMPDGNCLKCHIKFVKSTMVGHYFAEAIASSTIPWVSANILLWNIVCAELSLPVPMTFFAPTS